ncbi:MAG: hypothetical protein ABWK15_02275 [Dissulfuribacterales bacterium]
MLNSLNSVFQSFTNTSSLKSTSAHSVRKAGQEPEKYFGSRASGPVRQVEAVSSMRNAAPAGGLVLSLNDLKTMARTMFRRVSEKGGDASLHSDDPDLTLKKLILARLMNNGRLPKTRGSIEMWPSMSSFSPAQDPQDITAESASYLFLDIRVELQDSSAMQGKA